MKHDTDQSGWLVNECCQVGSLGLGKKKQGIEILISGIMTLVNEIIQAV